jgi:hypothetical protein
MVFLEHLDRKFVEIRFKNESVFSNFDDNFPLESKLVTIQLNDFTYYTDFEIGIIKFCSYLTYVVIIMAAIFFLNLFKGSSLVKVWNYVMYL